MDHSLLDQLSLLVADLADRAGEGGRYVLTEEREKELRRIYGTPCYMVMSPRPEGLTAYVVRFSDGPEVMRRTLLELDVEPETVDMITASVMAEGMRLAALEQRRKDQAN